MGRSPSLTDSFNKSMYRDAESISKSCNWTWDQSPGQLPQGLTRPRGRRPRKFGPTASCALAFHCDAGDTCTSKGSQRPRSHRERQHADGQPRVSGRPRATHVYRGAAQSATSVGGHNLHWDKVDSLLTDKSRRAGCGRRAPERRRHGQCGCDGGGASAAPKSEHGARPLASCVISRRASGPTRACQQLAVLSAPPSPPPRRYPRGFEQPPLPDTSTVRMAPGEATGTITRRNVGATRLNSPGVLGHKSKTVGFLWKPSFQTLNVIDDGDRRRYTSFSVMALNAVDPVRCPGESEWTSLTKTVNTLGVAANGPGIRVVVTPTHTPSAITLPYWYLGRFKRRAVKPSCQAQPRTPRRSIVAASFSIETTV